MAMPGVYNPVNQRALPVFDCICEQGSASNEAEVGTSGFVPYM